MACTQSAFVVARRSYLLHSAVGGAKCLGLVGNPASPNTVWRSYLLSRNVRIEEDFVDQVSQSSERRLARALLLLAGNGIQRKLHRFAGISQGTLAIMIGTTRARLNLFMNRFRKRGFIKYRGPLDANGGIHINSSRLAKILRTYLQPDWLMGIFCGPRVSGANMRCELRIALLFEVRLHLVNRIANGRP